MPPKRDKSTFIVGYVGRLTPVKGIHVLIEGFSLMKAPEARLRIVGWDPENTNTPYARRIKALAEKDSRVRLVDKTDQAGTVREYLGMDLLAIPSVWLETGPLTMMEALAAGVRVFGSRQIGQIGMLRDQGEVVEPNTPESWKQALAQEYRSSQRQQELRKAAGSSVQRTAHHVAREHREWYKSCTLQGHPKAKSSVALLESGASEASNHQILAEEVTK